MVEVIKKSINWAGQILTLETGRIAKQADGAVLVSYGNTTVLCCVVAEKKPSTESDFFPLNVHYQEKAYAAGKFPGGFTKREGKPSDHESLIARLIDRPIRPMFDKAFHNETQIICTVLSYEKSFRPDIPAMIGASAALAISGIPTSGIVGGCAISYKDGKFIVNSEEKTSLNLVVAGNKESVLMVESSASELPEEKMIEAIWYAHEAYQPVISLIEDLVKAAGKKRWKIEDNSACYNSLSKKYKTTLVKGIESAYKIKEKIACYESLDNLSADILQTITDPAEQIVFKTLFKDLEREVLRNKVIKTGKRIDGRGADDIRPITVETGVLPIVHGSALFTRGETQALATLTLGSAQDEQIVETIQGDFREHFMLHYNFDPYCVGEVARLGALSRREIGHGRLAYKALFPILPEKSKFPYTVRLVSEITESNGSSSMATVCAGCVALMNGGVPISKPVSGVAMGLIKDKKKAIVLTDILGTEDALGDMDFKVAGTADGITALQMDIKTNGVSKDIMIEALNKAKTARAIILEKMLAVQAGVNPISKNAPQIKVIRIAEHSTKDLIGPGGKIIREITDKTGAKIDVCDGGIVKIFASNGTVMDKVLSMIKIAIAGPEVDDIFVGTVVKIISSGAFVKIADNKEGFLHISELSKTHVKEVSDIISEGQEIKVRVINVSKDKIRLTMKDVA